MENNLKNLFPFYIGEKVIAVKNGDRCKGLIKGKNYMVTSLQRFACGIVIVGYGIPHNVNLAHILCTCGRIDTNIPNTYVAPSNYFAPLTESPFPSLTFKEVIEKEKVLTCNN